MQCRSRCFCIRCGRDHRSCNRGYHYWKQLTPTIEKHGARIFFEGTSPIIQSADVATASINTSISERGEPDARRELRFRAAPDLARAIANAGFDVVSIATPHIMDFGVQALEDTVTHLEWYNVKPIGAGMTPAAANAPAWLEVHSKKIAVLAYLRDSEFNIASLDVVAAAAFSQMTKTVSEVKRYRRPCNCMASLGKKGSRRRTIKHRSSTHFCTCPY